MVQFSDSQCTYSIYDIRIRRTEYTAHAVAIENVLSHKKQKLKMDRLPEKESSESSVIQRTAEKDEF